MEIKARKQKEICTLELEFKRISANVVQELC